MGDRMFSRRIVCRSIGAALAVAGVRSRSTSPSSPSEAIAAMEREVGGRIGLHAVNTGSGRVLSHRAHERFAMCSTFKLMLAACVLSRADEGALRLDRSVAFSRADLLPNSPIADSHPEGGTASVEDMLQSVVVASDNTAANLLLALIGGPAGYTAYLRRLGDATTRLDRTELDLNTNIAGDARDTTTPEAMLEDMRRVLLGDGLSMGGRDRLLGWMRHCTTGLERLRAKLPAGWEAGDKTGTGSRGAVNDVAVFYPPSRAPLLVTCYLSGSSAATKILNTVHARVGALIASSIG